MKNNCIKQIRVSIECLQSIHSLCSRVFIQNFNDKDWLHTVAALNEHIWNNYGMTKIPLLYVIRASEQSTDGTEDSCDNPLAQMIDHAPHWIPQG